MTYHRRRTPYPPYDRIGRRPTGGYRIRRCAECSTVPAEPGSPWCVRCGRRLGDDKPEEKRS